MIYDITLPLAPDTADLLIKRGVALVGVDYLACERGDNNEWPIHKTLLAHGIVIVESCDLSAVPVGSYQLSVLPLRLRDLDGSPCRAVLYS